MQFLCTRLWQTSYLSTYIWVRTFFIHTYWAALSLHHIMSFDWWILNWNPVRVFRLPSNLRYTSYLSRQNYCCSLICSWSIACRRCSDYIFILDLTHGFNGMGKDNCEARLETFNLSAMVRLILGIWRLIIFVMITSMSIMWYMRNMVQHSAKITKTKQNI